MKVNLSLRRQYLQATVSSGEIFIFIFGVRKLRWICLTFFLHFFTDERVKAGLANARAKGKVIGRKKVRDSDLIRKLLKAGMTFRQIAQIAKCSHGSVWAERKALMKEEEDLKQKQEEQARAEKEMSESGVIFPEVLKPEQT